MYLMNASHKMRRTTASQLFWNQGCTEFCHLQDNDTFWTTHNKKTLLCDWIFKLRKCIAVYCSVMCERSFCSSHHAGLKLCWHKSKLTKQWWFLLCPVCAIITLWLFHTLQKHKALTKNYDACMRTFHLNEGMKVYGAKNVELEIHVS